MPYRNTKIKVTLKSVNCDKRIKLTKTQKKEIKDKYDTGRYSIRGLSKKYNVNKRLIQFILFPERQKLNIEQRKERGGSKIYYDRIKNNAYMQKHRKHRQEVYLSGKLKINGQSKSNGGNMYKIEFDQEFDDMIITGFHRREIVISNYDITKFVDELCENEMISENSKYKELKEKLKKIKAENEKLKLENNGHGKNTD